MEKRGILILTAFSFLVSPSSAKSQQGKTPHSLHSIVFESYLMEPPSAEKMFDAVDLPSKEFPEKFSQLFAPRHKIQSIQLPEGVALPPEPMFLDIYTFKVSEELIGKQKRLSHYNEISKINYRIRFLSWSNDGYQVDIEGRNEDLKFNHILVSGAADKTKIVRIRHSANRILYFALTPDIKLPALSITDKTVKDLAPPVLLSQPFPPYPSVFSKAHYIELVRIGIIVTTKGSVDPEKFVIFECAHSLFARNCLDTIINYWIFKPATIKGVPVDVWGDIEVTFMRSR